MKHSGNISAIRVVGFCFMAAFTAMFISCAVTADDVPQEVTTYIEPPITASDRDHWSLKLRTPLETLNFERAVMQTISKISDGGRCQYAMGGQYAMRFLWFCPRQKGNII